MIWPNISRNNSINQKGLSLVELMVAMALGLLLVLGVGEIFLANKATLRVQEAMANVQETGRFAVGRIASSIRDAGFVGCAGLDLVVPNVIADNPPTDLSAFTNDTPISGLDNVLSGNDFDAVVGTDIITLRGAGNGGISLTGNLTPVNANIQVVNAFMEIKRHDLLLITDCANADLFRASTASDPDEKQTIAHGSDGNIDVNLSKPYGPDAFVLRPFLHSYYVRDTDRDNNGNDVFSLYVRDLNGAVHELAEGVSDLQVLYGVDTDGNRTADRYMDAGAITTDGIWGGVVSARISLLVDSVDNALQQPQTFTFLGTSTSPAESDRRMRQEFTGLFVLRNRTL
jgi:type IV pilus assembly protein PilW